MPLPWFQYLLFPNLSPLALSQVTRQVHFTFSSPSFPIALFVPIISLKTLPLRSSFHLISSSLSLLSSGDLGAWLASESALIGGDISPIPLLSSPDLDALCDPVAPALHASLPRSSPPRSSSFSTSVLFSSPHPHLAVSPSAPPAPSAQISSCQSGTTVNSSSISPFSAFPILREFIKWKHLHCQSDISYATFSLFLCIGSSIAVTQPEKETSPSPEVVNIKTSNQPNRQEQDSTTTTDSKAEPGRIR